MNKLTSTNVVKRWNSVFRCFELIDPRALNDQDASARANAEKAALARKLVAAAKRAPVSQFRGFLGNGGWMISVHTKKCARQRRNVASAQRVRELFPNPQRAQ